MRYQKIIVDADICIKIGSIEKFQFLETLFPLIADKIYMHRVVYTEIMSPLCAKQQVDNLIGKRVIELIDENSLGANDKQLYDATYQLLATVMLNKTCPRKNLGEVCSLSMAKTKSIPVFATDEKDLQPIIDFNLNTGIDNIICLRIVDIINQVRDGKISGLTRKQAKILWVISGKRKELFDTEIWPIDKVVRG